MFIAVVLWLSLLTAHPLHLSLTELNYNAPELTLEVSHRVFRDDIEQGLAAMCRCPVNAMADRPSANFDSLARAYVARHVRLLADGRPLTPSYLGHELDGDAMWLHLEATDLKPFATLTIEQSLLYEVYDDQSSLVNFTCGGQLRSARLRREQPRADIGCGR